MLYGITSGTLESWSELVVDVITDDDTRKPADHYHKKQDGVTTSCLLKRYVF